MMGPAPAKNGLHVTPRSLPSVYDGLRPTGVAGRSQGIKFELQTNPRPDGGRLRSAQVRRAQQAQRIVPAAGPRTWRVRDWRIRRFIAMWQPGTVSGSLACKFAAAGAIGEARRRNALRSLRPTFSSTNARELSGADRGL